MGIQTRNAKRLLPLLALVLAISTSTAVADSGNGNDQNEGVIYNSVLTPLPGNLPSVGFEALAFHEFGNAVNFAGGNNHELSKVVITMSSWGCASGSWLPGTCSTPEDASFSTPITLNIYNPSSDGTNPGTKIASITNTFKINFRPSASPLCVGSNAGKWFEKSSKTCFNGLAQNITFKLKNVTVAASAIFGISYNTTHYGPAPIGQSAACFSTAAGCGYDSLNVAVTEDPTDVRVGTSVIPGKLWVSSSMGSQYADGGAAGLGTFRLDSPSAAAWWGANSPYTSAPWYVPAIKVFGSQGGKADKQSENNSHSSDTGKEKGDSKVGIKRD